jgi:phospholipid/cholesterol/gamma-HCH transport system substrate-binding protein
METRARYALIGAFTLSVIGAAFLFVYWLNAAGGLGARSVYLVRYDGPVAGLLKGSAVVFNGIRVGEVTELVLDPAEPRRVTATIAVSPTAPVRADTKAGIDFQGLGGTPVVALVGGTADAARLAGDSSSPPLLIAESDAGQGLTQVARDAARRIGAVVKDNAEPLRDLIGNIDKFSGALARNSDRIDGILAGIERMTGGGTKVTPRVFDLSAARTFAAIPKLPQGQLLIAEPTTLNAFESEKIVVDSGTGETANIEGAQWPDLLTRVVQARLAQSFENANYLQALGRAPDTFKADHQLLVEIKSFAIDKAGGPKAKVELVARLMDSEGKLVDARTFRAEEPVPELMAAQAASALSASFAHVAAEIVAWVCATL